MGSAVAESALKKPSRRKPRPPAGKGLSDEAAMTRVRVCTIEISKHCRGWAIIPWKEI